MPLLQCCCCCCCVERKRQRYRKRALVSDPLTRLHPLPGRYARSRGIFGPVLTRKGKEVLGKIAPLEKFTLPKSPTGTTRFGIVKEPPKPSVIFSAFSRSSCRGTLLNLSRIFSTLHLNVLYCIRSYTSWRPISMALTISQSIFSSFLPERRLTIHFQIFYVVLFFPFLSSL